ncbi:MAG: aspartate--tRNA ligase [Candidatus Dadabacteria bacterium]|nr:MAG: aspartate--tRNA ligase [Candidatus Dadabacteria bacterium]
MESLLQSIYRTHTLSELREADVGKIVKLSGWIRRKRDHGGILFVDLADHYGITQVIFRGELKEEAQKIRLESVINVTGTVKLRNEENINNKISTGKIEVDASKFEVLSHAKTLPFKVSEEDTSPEHIRLKYRFLELRREKLHTNMMLRSRVIRAVRDIMHDMGFVEFQTPILTSSSPEGARDFIVPSRVHPGKFFALPQAPQIFKQLIMASGFDRYFQIAPCFRDEDPRADRSPGEFYQIDMELAFVEQEDVLKVNEELFYRLFTTVQTEKKVTPLPFPRLPYHVVMERYGTDKPDLRNPLEISKVSQAFLESEFRIFSAAAKDAQQEIYCIPVANIPPPPRKFFDDLIDTVKKHFGLGLSYVICEEPDRPLRGGIAKFLTDKETTFIKEKLGRNRGVVFFGAGLPKSVLPMLGWLRDHLGHEFNLLNDDSFNFLFVVDFPLYEMDEQTGNIAFTHNPFSMPQGGIEALNTKEPLQILASQYDLVCNGYELGSGGIRSHTPELLYKAFEIVGYPKSTVDDKFGAMIRAFELGAPPHGGIAHGVDRVVMLLAGETAIRNVILFPLAQTVEDLMMGAPSKLSPEQLEEVHIKVVLPDGDAD